MTNIIDGETEYSEIKELVECALSAYTKSQADEYIKRLEFIRHSGGYCGYIATAFSSLVASTQNASGNVKDKERKCMFAYQDLYKLQGLIDNDKQEDKPND